MSVEDFRAAVHEFCVYPNLKKNIRTIWDLRSADWSELFEPDISRTIGHIEKHLEGLGAGCKMAYVASRDVEYGMARMFQSLAGNPLLRIAVSRNLEEATR